MMIMQINCVSYLEVLNDFKGVLLRLITLLKEGLSK